MEKPEDTDEEGGFRGQLLRCTVLLLVLSALVGLNAFAVVPPYLRRRHLKRRLGALPDPDDDDHDRGEISGPSFVVGPDGS